MPTIPGLRDRIRQEDDARYRVLPVEDVLDDDLKTAFGTFALRARINGPAVEYLLCPMDSPANRLLFGHNDLFTSPPAGITATDDADALRQALLLVWGRVNQGVAALDAMVREAGAVQG